MGKNRSSFVICSRARTRWFISNEAGRVKDIFLLFFTYLSLRFSSLGTPVRLRGRAVLLDG